MISIDFETNLIQRARLAPEPVCMSWAQEQCGPGVYIGQDIPDTLRGWLEGPGVLVGTNVAFDMGVACEHYPDLLPLVWDKYDRFEIQDISLNQRLIDYATRGQEAHEGYSLETLTARYELPPVDKSGPWRLEYRALKGVPLSQWPQGAIDYVLADADRPLRIAQAQHAYDAEWAAHGRGRLLHLAGREARKAFALHLASCWGLRTDPGRVRALQAEIAATLDQAGAALRDCGLVRPDGTRDTKAAKARMAASVACPLLTDTGQISLDKEACDASGDPVLEAYSLYSQANTLRARVDDLAEGVDMPLQTSYQSLLETGRTSSRKPSPPLIGIQAQNFPRKEGPRECLTPRPGHAFVSADLPSAELRSLAQTCIDLFGYSVMGDQLNAGRDLHLWFGGKILGLEYEQALARADEPLLKEARQNAKPCNFGFPGGMGADKFVQFAWMSYRIRMEPAKAQQLKGVWLAAFPEMREYFAYMSRLVGDKGVALFKHPRSGRWRGRTPYCATCNSHFQELTGMGASEALAAVSRACYCDRSSALWNSRPVMYTHDEIVLETPLDRAHEAALELSAVMARVFSEWHPDVPALPCTGQGKDPRVVAPCVSMQYSKGMRAVWSEGRLVPWTT